MANRRTQDERTQTMLRLYLAGETLDEVGSHYGISRQRVHQLLRNCPEYSSEQGRDVRYLLGIEDRAQAETAKAERRERRCLLLYGMTSEQLAEHRKDHGTTPFRRFCEQRRSARKRNIGWELSFARWWQLWQESGRWKQRGRGLGFCMARHGDDGPYNEGNVYICTIGQNFSDSYITKPWRDRFPDGHPKCTPGHGRGWSYDPRNRKNRYTVRCQHRYIGSFATELAARRAYLKAAREACKSRPDVVQ